MKNEILIYQKFFAYLFFDDVINFDEFEKYSDLEFFQSPFILEIRNEEDAALYVPEKINLFFPGISKKLWDIIFSVSIELIISIKEISDNPETFSSVSGLFYFYSMKIDHLYRNVFIELYDENL